MLEDSDSEPMPKRSKSGMEQFFGRHFGFSTQSAHSSSTPLPTLTAVRNQVKIELVIYDSEVAIPTSTSPLEWWNEKSAKLPLSSKLARQRLAVQGTSVSVEQIFSSAGEIVNAKRAPLRGELVNMLIFLNKNYII